MALRKPFIDACGNEFEAVYFRAVQISITADTATLVFQAYKDLESFEAGKQGLPGGIKSYLLTGEEFEAFAGAALNGETLYDALIAATEAYAVSKFDSVGKGGKPGSYFEDATPDKIADKTPPIKKK